MPDFSYSTLAGLVVISAKAPRIIECWLSVPTSTRFQEQKTEPLNDYQSQKNIT